MPKTLSMMELAASLKDVKIDDVKMEMDKITKQAAPVRAAREKVNQKIVELQAQAREFSKEIRDIEAPLMGLSKLVTLSVASGIVPGNTTRVTGRPPRTAQGRALPAEGTGEDTTAAE